MSNSKQELSSRYYWAEGAACLLGGILMVFGLIGLAPSQVIPILQISPLHADHIPRIIAVGVIFITFYMAFEWRTSLLSARQITANKWRVRSVFLWVSVCLFASYNKLLQGTGVEFANPVWYLAFFVLGYSIGMGLYCVVFAALMIRSRDEANALRLPRVPIASGAQFITWGPLIIVLFIIYFLLLNYVPYISVEIASLLTCGTFLWVMVEGGMNLLRFSSLDGIHVPYRERIASLREIHNKHDYMRSLEAFNPCTEIKACITPDDSPEETQRKIRKLISKGGLDDIANYRGVLLSEIKIKFFPKDGNLDDPEIKNCALKIIVPGDEDFVVLRMIPFNQKISAIDYRTPVKILERHATAFLESLGYPENISIDEMMDYTLKKTIEEVFVSKGGDDMQMLEFFVQKGDSENVNAILQRKPHLNTRGIGGWTTLLHAAANGDVVIMRMLLESGANPDMSNDLGLTPLMYGSRYKNLEVCNVLLEYGAKLDIQDVRGVTALMTACAIGTLDIVEILVQAGADLEIKDTGLHTALDIAHSFGHGSIAKFLRNKMSL